MALTLQSGLRDTRLFVWGQPRGPWLFVLKEITCHAMGCHARYVMLCYGMPCQVCDVMLWDDMPGMWCHAMWFHARYVMSCYGMPCQVCDAMPGMWCHAMGYHARYVMSWKVCDVMLWDAMPYMWYHGMACIARYVIPSMLWNIMPGMWCQAIGKKPGKKWYVSCYVRTLCDGTRWCEGANIIGMLMMYLYLMACSVMGCHIGKSNGNALCDFTLCGDIL